MKHSEIYNKHEDHRKGGGKPKKKGEKTDRVDRLARTSFKRYVQSLKTADLEEDLDDDLTDE